MARTHDDVPARNDPFEESGNRGLASAFTVGREIRLLKCGVPVPQIIGAAVAALGAFGLISISGVPGGVFCRGAAWLAGLLSGSPVACVENGWLLSAPVPAVVTEACSGTTFFVMVAALVGWHVGKHFRYTAVACLMAMVGALPLAIAINAVRIVAVTQAHRWVIPHFPESYGSFLHMLTGMAAFLPALIALNLAFETYGNSRIHHAAV